MKPTNRAYGLVSKENAGIYMLTLADSPESASNFFLQTVTTKELSRFTVEPMLVMVDQEPIPMTSSPASVISFDEITVLKYKNLVLERPRSFGHRQYFQYQALLFIHPSKPERRDILIWRKPNAASIALDSDIFERLCLEEKWREDKVRGVDETITGKASKKIKLRIFEYNNKLLQDPFVFPIAVYENHWSWDGTKSLVEFGKVIGVANKKSFVKQLIREIESLTTT